MVTRLAFTSCTDPMDDPVQPLWDAMAAVKPDHLVLLGDQIYMDYGMWIFRSKNPPIGRPARMSDEDFAAVMHERYAKQWEIFRNSGLSQLAGLRIHGIWDDHDFAWNNSYGDGGSNGANGPGDKRDPVNRTKQAISRRLMQDFFGALRSPGSTYPANPFEDGAVPPADLSQPWVCADPPGSASVALAPGVKLLLTDGRTFRTRTNRTDATVFGNAQWEWIRDEIGPDHVCLLASGSTLDQGGTHLDLYGDLDRLLEAAHDRSARLLCLTGDVHKVDWRHHGPRVYEAVASGGARTLFGRSGAYGLVQIDDKKVKVSLFNGEGRSLERTIDLATWEEE